MPTAYSKPIDGPLTSSRYAAMLKKQADADLKIQEAQLAQNEHKAEMMETIRQLEEKLVQSQKTSEKLMKENRDLTSKLDEDNNKPIFAPAKSAARQAFIDKQFDTSHWKAFLESEGGNPIRFPAGDEQVASLINHYVDVTEYKSSDLVRTPPVKGKLNVEMHDPAKSKVKKSMGIRSNFLLPTIFYAPHLQVEGFSSFLKCRFKCHGKCGGNTAAEASGKPNGAFHNLLPTTPRLVFTQGNGLAVYMAARYRCPNPSCRHEWAADSDEMVSHPEFVERFSNSMPATVVGNSGHGYTSGFLTNAVRTWTSKMSINEYANVATNDIHTWIKQVEVQLLQTINVKYVKKLEEELKFFGSSASTAAQRLPMHLAALDEFLEEMKKVRQSIPTPNAASIRTACTHYVVKRKSIFLTYMGNLDAGVYCTLSADHTFKIAKALRKLFGKKKHVALFTVFNGNGEPISQVFTTDTTLKSLEPCLMELRERLARQAEFKKKRYPLVIYLDNCCSFGPSIRKIFSNLDGIKIEVYVKLDLFHWTMRWNRKCKIRNTPFGRQFMGLVNNRLFNSTGHIRPYAELGPEFERLKEHPVTQYLFAKFKEFKRVWELQISHLECLAQIPPDAWGFDDKVWLPRATWERYHGCINSQVMTASGQSEGSTDCRLMLLNHRWYIAKGIQHRGHKEHNCEDPFLMELGAAAFASWKASIEMLQCHIIGAADIPDLEFNRQAESFKSRSNPFAGYPIPRSLGVHKLMEDFEWFGTSYQHQGEPQPKAALGKWVETELCSKCPTMNFKTSTGEEVSSQVQNLRVSNNSDAHLQNELKKFLGPVVFSDSWVSFSTIITTLPSDEDLSEKFNAVVKITDAEEPDVDEDMDEQTRDSTVLFNQFFMYIKALNLASYTTPNKATEYPVSEFKDQVNSLACIDDLLDALATLTDSVIAFFYIKDGLKASLHFPRERENWSQVVGIACAAPAKLKFIEGMANFDFLVDCEESDYQARIQQYSTADITYAPPLPPSTQDAQINLGAPTLEVPAATATATAGDDGAERKKKRSPRGADAAREEPKGSKDEFETCELILFLQVLDNIWVLGSDAPHCQAVERRLNDFAWPNGNSNGEIDPALRRHFHVWEADSWKGRLSQMKTCDFTNKYNLDKFFSDNFKMRMWNYDANGPDKQRDPTVCSATVIGSLRAKIKSVKDKKKQKEKKK